MGPITVAGPACDHDDDRLERARPRDLGGTAVTREVTAALVDRVGG